MTRTNWHNRKTREGNKKNDKITNIWQSLFHSNSTIFPLFNLVKSWIFFLNFFVCCLSVAGKERKKTNLRFFQDFPPQLSSFCHRSSSFSHYPGGCSWLVGSAKLFDSKFEKKNRKKKKLNSNASINIQRVTRLASGTDASSEQERPSLNMPSSSRRSVSAIPCWTPAPHQSTAESQHSATWKTAQPGET